MKPGSPVTTSAAGKDLVRTSSCLWIWGLPGALLLAADAAWHAHDGVPTLAAGLGFPLCVAWLGVGCLIDGYLLPPLAVLGLLNAAGITSIRWQSYLNIFLLIIIVGFVLECCGPK